MQQLENPSHLCQLVRNSNSCLKVLNEAQDSFDPNPSFLYILAIKQTFQYPYGVHSNDVLQLYKNNRNYPLIYFPRSKRLLPAHSNSSFACHNKTGTEILVINYTIYLLPSRCNDISPKSCFTVLRVAESSFFLIGKR